MVTIKDLKDLAKVIALCRKTGVQSIKIDNIEFHLGALPQNKNKVVADYSQDFPEASVQVPKYTAVSPGPDTKIDTDELTDDQLLFYSVSNQDPGEHQPQ